MSPELSIQPGQISVRLFCYAKLGRADPTLLHHRTVITTNSLGETQLSRPVDLICLFLRGENERQRTTWWHYCTVLCTVFLAVLNCTTWYVVRSTLCLFCLFRGVKNEKHSIDRKQLHQFSLYNLCRAWNLGRKYFKKPKNSVENSCTKIYFSGMIEKYFVLVWEKLADKKWANWQAQWMNSLTSVEIETLRELRERENIKTNVN